MSRDYLTLGPTPCDEDCAQVGSENYYSRAREECRRYLDLLRKLFGQEPKGAQLAIKSFPHDFGSYHEVVIWYDDQFPESIEYAFQMEGNLPETW